MYDIAKDILYDNVTSLSFSFPSVNNCLVFTFVTTSGTKKIITTAFIVYNLMYSVFVYTNTKNVRKAEGSNKNQRADIFVYQQITMCKYFDREYFCHRFFMQTHSKPLFPGKRIRGRG